MIFSTVHFVDNFGLVGTAEHETTSSGATDGQQVLVLRIAPRDQRAAIRGLLDCPDLERRGLVRTIGAAIVKAQRDKRDREPVSRLEEERLIAYVREKYSD